MCLRWWPLVHDRCETNERTNRTNDSDYKSNSSETTQETQDLGETTSKANDQQANTRDQKDLGSRPCGVGEVYAGLQTEATTRQAWSIGNSGWYA